jgi:hypothetical protein
MMTFRRTPSEGHPMRITYVLNQQTYLLIQYTHNLSLSLTPPAFLFNNPFSFCSTIPSLLFSNPFVDDMKMNRLCLGLLQVSFSNHSFHSWGSTGLLTEKIFLLVVLEVLARPLDIHKHAISTPDVN